MVIGIRRTPQARALRNPSMFRGIVKTAIALGLTSFLVAVTSAVHYRPRAEAAGTVADEPALVPEATSPGVAVSNSDLEQLRVKNLLFPISGFDMRRLHDAFDELRGGSRRHGALDLLAARGTPVLAVEDGRVARIHNSVGKGGLSVYHFDPTETYCYYYAHLDRYADGLREGAQLKKGDVIGYVGSTGNAPPQTPHLHFAAFKLGPEKRWGHGVPINTFALWAPKPPSG